MEQKSYTHANPIWRERANFIIGAKCSEDASTVREWEQLWSRRISGKRFEICCIPFFVYSLALGDEVEVAPEWGLPYMVQRVVKHAGHYTFRVWFEDTAPPNTREEVSAEVTRLGCLVEWSSDNLLAVDASSQEQAQLVADILESREKRGHLVYETGRI